MKRSKLSITALTFSLIAGAASAGPFGLDQGQDIKALEQEDLENGVSLINPPSPHSAFENYMVKSQKGCGLTKIVAIGKTIDADSTGSSLRSEYSQFKSALTEKYGEGNSYEYLNPGSIWDEYSDWVMSIKVGDRKHVTYWVDENNSFPDNIGAISLEISATGSRSGYVSLGYEFDNHERCSGEAREKENNVL